MSRKYVTMKAPIFSSLPSVELPAEADVKLARILRRAAGLADVPDPLEPNPGGVLWVIHYVRSILSVVPFPDDYERHSRQAARDLEELQIDLGEIRRRIEKIDDRYESWLNRFGSQNYREFFEISGSDDGTRMKELWRAALEEPSETWTVPAAVAAIRRLERAIPEVIDIADGHADLVPRTGRRKNFAAHSIAETVANYVREVTGEPPGPRRRYSGSDFERTLTEIFELFELKADAQAPAKAALLKLGKDG